MKAILEKACMLDFCLGFTRDDPGKTHCLSPHGSGVVSIQEFQRGGGRGGALRFAILPGKAIPVLYTVCGLDLPVRGVPISPPKYEYL